MRIKTKDILIFAGLIGLYVLLIFNRPEKTVFPQPTINEVETRIIEKDTIIFNNEKIVIREKNKAAETRFLFDSLFVELEKVKQQRDTIQIIQIQDTIINTLNVENSHLKNVIVGQDSIIIAQRYIIGSKDTIIQIQTHESKKFKRQRNISMIINAGLTGILILK
tara:strand:- start:330 stop:824 length:495 start_codon:yes stop_codon:yes gene_type:complete